MHAGADGIAGVALDLLDELVRDERLRSWFEPEYWVVSGRRQVVRPYQRTGIPRWLGSVLDRLGVGVGRTAPRTIRRYLDALRDGDVAWLFPAVPVDVFRSARSRGSVVVKELVNTALGYHREALRRAYDAIGWSPGALPKQCDVDAEIAELAEVDWYFSPSEEVSRSYVAVGADPERLIATSYGWSPRLFRPRRQPRRGGRLRFLFAGYGSIRKGVPHLLRAWERADLDAELVLVGGFSDEVAERCAAQLRAPNVTSHPHVRDLAPFYEQADAFVLPSFEEGSPLVMYMAMAAGLPCLSSPHSAGEIVRHEQEALITAADDVHGWVEALQRLAQDEQLRERLGDAARRRGENYTYDKVAYRRFEALAKRIGHSG